MKIDAEQIREAKHYAEGCILALSVLEKLAAIHRESVEKCTSEELAFLEAEFKRGFLQAVSRLGDRFFEFADRVKSIAVEAGSDNQGRSEK